MKKMIQLFLIAIISLTSTFFILGGKVEVEAACKMGEYYDSLVKKACTKTVESSNQATNVGKINKAFDSFANSIILLSTGIALIMIVYSGFQYTMSEGDVKKVLEAKTNLIRAGIGILIAFSANSILNLFSAFTTL